MDVLTRIVASGPVASVAIAAISRIEDLTSYAITLSREHKVRSGDVLSNSPDLSSPVFCRYC